MKKYLFLIIFSSFIPALATADINTACSSGGSIDCIGYNTAKIHFSDFVIAPDRKSFYVPQDFYNDFTAINLATSTDDIPNYGWYCGRNTCQIVPEIPEYFPDGVYSYSDREVGSVENSANSLIFIVKGGKIYKDGETIPYQTTEIALAIILVLLFLGTIQRVYSYTTSNRKKPWHY